MTLAVNLANLVDALGTDGTITDAKSISDKPNSSTGYFDLPSGTTGQRPGSPNTGMVRHNSSLGLIETWNGTTWTGLGGSATISSTAPASPTDGAFWLNSETGDLYTYGPGGWILAGGFGGSYNDLTNKPALSTVATTGSYADLINKPAITPAAVSDQANTSTGYFGMPTGTTAQRPVSPANGFTRINTTTNYLEVYYNGSWVNMQYIGLISATYSGATLSYSGNYILLTYTGTTGSFTPTVVPTGATVDYVIVGGGGAGGIDQGGGGGAGGYLTGSIAVAQQAYPITIGGVATSIASQVFVNGNPSTAFGLTAVGGGGGAGISYSSRTGNSGGSGGGASSAWSSGVVGLGGAASPSGQGNAGGNGSTGGSNSSGGGGGGAGAAGASAVGNAAGLGGVGIANPFAGSTAGQLVNGTYYLAGGGGGGTYQGTRAAGGNGGGGSGGGPSTVFDGGSGALNTGGGGGGGVGTSAGTVGSGGSGVVIIRYRYQ
jgi:hypothetical protein